MQLFQQRLPCLAPQLSQAAGRLHQIVRPRMRPAEHHCWASGISAPERPVLCLPLFSSSTPDFAPPPPPVHATPPAATPPAATAAEQTGSRGMIPTAGKRLTIAVAQVLGVLSGFAVLVTLCIQAPRAFHTIMASLFKAMGISTTGNGEIGSALEAIGLLGTVLACIVSAVYQVAAAWESLQDGIEQVQQQQQGLKEELKDLLRQQEARQQQQQQQQEARQQQQLQQQLQQQDARQEQQMQQQQLKLQLDTVRDQLRQQEARQQQQLQQQETRQEQQQMKLQEQETRQEQRQMKLQLDSVSAKLSSMDQNGSRRWF